MSNYLSSLWDGILHDAGDIGDGKVNVLLSEIVFASVAILVVVKTFIPIIYTQKKSTIKMMLLISYNKCFLNYTDE